MKKIKYLLYTFILFTLIIPCCYAAPSYTFSVSSGTITNGNKVSATLTVKNTAAWNVKITSAGSTNGCTNAWADTTSDGKDVTKTFTVTCKASSVGTINFTLSGDITGSSGTTYISGSKSVTVKEKAPDSVINTLKSLKVNDYELTPEFDKDTLEYNVSVPPTTTKVNIEATRVDNTSSVSGTGEFEVNEGNNKFEIVVTAQSGAVRTYTVNVNVEDTNPIKVNVDNEELSILKTSRNLEIPSLYTESTININDNEVPCFINDVTNITLVALKNNIGQINFYMYDNGKYTKYIELIGNSSVIYPTNEEINIKGYNADSIKIDNVTIKAYKYKDLDNFYILKGMDLETGKINIYSYDINNKTFQIYNEELFNLLNNDINFYLYFLLGSGSIIILCLIIIISLMSSKSKVKKLINDLRLEVEKSKKEV